MDSHLTGIGRRLGRGVLLTAYAILAADVVEAERTLAAQGEEVEGRIRPPVEPAGPEVTPVKKDAVDGGIDAVTVNSTKPPLQARILFRVPPRF
jgi:hypothetical protein